MTDLPYAEDVAYWRTGRRDSTGIGHAVAGGVDAVATDKWLID